MTGPLGERERKSQGPDWMGGKTGKDWGVDRRGELSEMQSMPVREWPDRWKEVF